ncbi:ankyrin repeat protein [Beauveria bassiana ARSEF 2860]|uniref:Ankyrin repeat protein n=1 Tax=Beauveria bassiana (strain ARSEF 2860) TaxID=655819 RepID=J4KMA4_BEAB2|nr:ankyrin repeat protein [Beauveria bassiana ARSEF 2860]EJP63609.1 ankyrin repeat protein [Beauveria bassiana ARSEF 2860]
MTSQSLPALTIPSDINLLPELSPDHSRSPSSYGLSATTGRPAMWTRFHQCKMVCLYVYTTLPLEKIVKVVHQKTSPKRRPGQDSANKNLNTLLDKEPRWLHPRTNEDMGRRLEQLSLSLSRMPSRLNATPYGRASSYTTEPSFLHAPFKSNGTTSSALLGVPQHSMASRSAPTSPTSSYPAFAEWSPSPPFKTPSASTYHPKEERDRMLFAPFLRRATMASCSTTTSTSSLTTVLADYSPSYRSAVKGLMRRLSGFFPRSRDVSPFSEPISVVMDWLDDGAGPTPYTGTPFPLPGDFLSIDKYMQSPQMLNQVCRSVLYSAARELLQVPATSLPWVTPNGLTEKGSRILAGCIRESDFSEVDVFGNTLLHFVAARGHATDLCSIIRQLKDGDILQQANTAGQTFLHVMAQGTTETPSFVTELIRSLRKDHDIDIYAQDHYGRNFFHMLWANGVGQTILDDILADDILMSGDSERWSTRDAFGEDLRISAPRVPHGLPIDHTLLLDSGMDPAESSASSVELQLVHFINHEVKQDPRAENSHGRNGLHCLAAVNFGLASAPTASGMTGDPDAASPRGRRRTSGGSKKETGSSEGPMKTRLDSLRDVLSWGVRANAYDANGNTPLMAFVAQLPEDGNYKLGPRILEILIEAGGNVDARNRAGETALHIAVRCGRKLAAKALVDQGANVYARDALGRSVLDVADAKILAAGRGYPGEYARLEACRAWLSGQKGGAIQNPTVLDEWGLVQWKRSVDRSRF